MNKSVLLKCYFAYLIQNAKLSFSPLNKIKQLYFQYNMIEYTLESIQKLYA